MNKPKTILDVGCGCGAIYELCRRELPDIEYYGLDYSENAIELAKKTWDKSRFSVKDCISLTNEDVEPYDLVHMGALLDVLPNGDEVLEHILSTSPKSVLITRMKLTKKESYYNTYEAYNEIITCEYYHNRHNFIKLCEKYGYSISNIRDNFYLNQIK
jgi:trans-aconitate methyltransferase